MKGRRRDWRVCLILRGPWGFGDSGVVRVEWEESSEEVLGAEE